MTRSSNNGGYLDISYPCFNSTCQAIQLTENSSWCIIASKASFAHSRTKFMLESSSLCLTCMSFREVRVGVGLRSFSRYGEWNDAWDLPIVNNEGCNFFYITSNISSGCIKLKELVFYLVCDKDGGGRQKKGFDKPSMAIGKR